MSIKDKAMLVQPSISVWSARRIDKAVTREVAQRHGADARKAGRYNKCLIDPEAESFVEVRRIAQAARDFHYSHTLPWTQQGAQILPAAEYWEYSAQMKEYQDKFRQAARTFLAEYPALKEKARRDLNGLYREEDYPRSTEVASKFSFEVHFLPIPDKEDWRVSLGAHEEAMIRAQIEANLQQAVENAMRELWQRLLEAVQRMVDRLSTEEPRFRDTMVENLRELVDLVPRLNLVSDPKLEAIRQEIAQHLSGHAPEALRLDAAKRAAVAAKAAEIAQKIAIYGGVR